MGRVFQGSWETLPAESMEGEGSATRTSKALRCMGMIKCHTMVHGTCIIVVWLESSQLLRFDLLWSIDIVMDHLYSKITDDKVVSMKLAYGDLVSSIIYGLVPRPHPARISPACDTESDMETWRNEGPYRISCSLARSNDTPLPPKSGYSWARWGFKTSMAPIVGQTK